MMPNLQQRHLFEPACASIAYSLGASASPSSYRCRAILQTQHQRSLFPGTP